MILVTATGKILLLNYKNIRLSSYTDNITYYINNDVAEVIK